MRGAANQLLGVLRLDKPKTVTVGAGNANVASNRPFQDAIASMLASAPAVTDEEADSSLANSGAASAYVGFPIQLVGARNDTPKLVGVGGRNVQATIDYSTIRTVLDQAGRNAVSVPSAIDRAPAALHVPRGLRAAYGNCPVAAAPTIQGQLQGPPPPSPDNGNCVVLFETKPAVAELPASVPIDQLAEIAFELAGMSPNQSDAYRRVVDWRASLALALPRGIRSYDTLSVHGVRGMLINTAARRGPTYALVWQRSGLVFLLTAYGNSADAVALAESVQ